MHIIDLPEMPRFFTAPAKHGTTNNSSTSAFSVTFVHTMKMMGFDETLYFKALPRFPTTSWIETMSGKSTKRYYIKVLLTFHVSRHTTKMMKFHEVLYFKALPRFPTTSWTEMKCGKSTKRYYIKVLFTFHVPLQTMKMTKINERL